MKNITKDIKLKSLPALHYSKVDELLINNNNKLERQTYIENNLWKFTIYNNILFEILLNYINKIITKNIKIKSSIKWYLILLVILFTIIGLLSIYYTYFYVYIINPKLCIILQ